MLAFETAYQLGVQPADAADELPGRQQRHGPNIFVHAAATASRPTASRWASWATAIRSGSRASPPTATSTMSAISSTCGGLTAKYTFNRHVVRRSIAMQGGWENNSGQSYIGKIDSQAFGAQIGANVTKNFSADGRLRFEFRGRPIPSFCPRTSPAATPTIRSRRRRRSPISCR